MKTSEKLQKRLLEELGLDMQLPQRIPRNRHTRGTGTFAWVARYAEGGWAGEIGSEDTMTECVNAVSLGQYRQRGTGTLCIVAEDTPQRDREHEDE